MRVLIADDSVLMLDRLRAIISGFKQAEIVGELQNGNDALEALKSLKPDLAIIDIKMPGLNGLEVLYNIRKENKVLTFIIFTLFASDYIADLAIKSGADYFFNKVDDFDKLSHVVSEMIFKYDSDNKIGLAAS